jgi:phage terminase large subunit-like protein
MTTLNAALDLVHGLVIESGARWGEAAHDVQREDARAVLDPDTATPFNYLTRSRGWSKTTDLGAVAIGAMLAQLTPGARCYALAADRDQGRLLVDAIAGFAARTPELRDALKIDAYRVTATRAGSVLEVLAADVAGSWGIRPAFVVIDELAQWATTPGPRALFEAVTSAAAKVAGARLAIITTAGDPAHWSYKMLEHARVDPLWRVREVPGPAPWLERERVDEQRRRLPPSSFARLFLNEWTAPEDRLTSAESLARCVVLDGPLPPQRGVSYVVGLDVGTVHDATAAIVCHAEPVERESGLAGVRVVVDRIHTWTGSRSSPVQLADVGEWLAYVAREYHDAAIVFDPHQAIDLTQRLSRAGITTEKFDFTAASVGRLALALYQAIRNGTLALPDDPELLDELQHVRLRETAPGVYRLDHDPDRHDDRAVALALAVHHLTERPEPSGVWSSSVARGRFPARVEEGATYAGRAAARRLRGGGPALDRVRALTGLGPFDSRGGS